MPTWELDTCGCRIDIYRDKFLPTGKSYIKCPAHAHLSDEEVWETVYGKNIDGECPTKNFSIQALADIAHLDGTQIPFYFDSDRKLHIKIPNADKTKTIAPLLANKENLVNEINKKVPWKLKNQVVID